MPARAAERPLGAAQQPRVGVEGDAVPHQLEGRDGIGERRGQRRDIPVLGGQRIERLLGALDHRREVDLLPGVLRDVDDAAGRVGGQVRDGRQPEAVGRRRRVGGRVSAVPWAWTALVSRPFPVTATAASNTAPALERTREYIPWDLRRVVGDTPTRMRMMDSSGAPDSTDPGVARDATYVVIGGPTPGVWSAPFRLLERSPPGRRLRTR